MVKIKRFAAGFFFLGLMVYPFFVRGQAAQEKTGTWMFGGEADLNSIYVWRGLALSDGAVLQPSVWVSRSNFTLSGWGNFVLNKEPNQGQFNEFDLVISYRGIWKNFEVEPAIQFYTYPNQPGEPSTGEFSIQVSYLIGSFVIETAHYFDFIEYGGAYIGEVGLEYHREISSKLSVDGALRFDWANAKFNGVYALWEKSAFNGMAVEISLTYYLKDFLYVRPHLEWNHRLDKDMRRWLAKPTIANFGFAVGMEY
jgi:hypothetical protein